ncbi:hypothetical protein OIU84_019303 [Salix udensis]|uniref:Uncharacterized protein n=1 Tax=Salix udensis TaxID=889485 RepID=A0AAD6PK45_9ROSI|nr:hypothetical protein OIU84_019303 [Salix udensis]
MDKSKNKDREGTSSKERDILGVKLRCCCRFAGVAEFFCRLFWPVKGTSKKDGDLLCQAVTLKEADDTIRVSSGAFSYSVRLAALPFQFAILRVCSVLTHIIYANRFSKPLCTSPLLMSTLPFSIVVTFGPFS